MNEKSFTFALICIAAAFTLFFGFTVIPPLIADPNLVAAMMAGFVNPYAAGYSTDVIACWLILCVWIIYEARTLSIKNGWVFLLLGMVPGVAVGFSLYLVSRHYQLRHLQEDDQKGVK